ncbi:hypothetical protein [Microbacterium sp. AG238]|jgi:hypothetical protein|uniref:hypothetical protein n=1 Tax=Microbacterium sp. AG238 TaxID=2183994 RepID=UPI000E722797|nr:hypothetical protein [Microbacterium sp. AG238]RKE60557.1 hypothetical protein DEU36_3002 [Microbacterium sp. AG238]
MEQFLDADVPVGRAAVAGIPLPPFATAADHQRYLDMLQLYLAMLDPGGPATNTVILNEALAAERRSADAGPLSPLALTASLSSFFPAPWTPDALATALAGRFGAPVRHRDAWRWMGDPDFSAIPREGGGWDIVRHERGSFSNGVLTHDGDLVLLWMDHFRSRFPLPFGHSYQRSDADLLAPAVRAARRAHDVNTAYPYLVTWRTERDAALGES